MSYERPAGPTPAPSPGADSTAIHDDTAGEIAAVAAKSPLDLADLILIEDSAAGDAKKSTTFASVVNRGNVVTVTQASDLGTPVSGVITLPNLTYKALNSVDITPNVLVGSGRTVLTGENRHDCQIVTDTTTAPDPSLPLIGDGIIEVDCLTLVNPGGQCINQTVAPGTALTLRNSFVANGAQDLVDDGTGFAAVVIDSCRWTTVVVGGLPVTGEGGIKLEGPFAIVGLTSSGGAFLTQASGALFEMESAGAIANQIEVISCLILPSASQTALLITEGAPPTEGAVIRDCGFGSVGTGLAGVNADTLGWDVTNPGARDSTAAAVESFAGNGDSTTISLQNTWTPITTSVGTPWVMGAASVRFTLVSGDRLRYDGKSEHKFTLDVVAVVEGAANNQVYEIRVQRERSAAVTTIDGPFRADFRTTVPAYAVGAGLADLIEGDEIWLEIRNITSDADCTVLDASLRAGSSS